MQSQEVDELQNVDLTKTPEAPRYQRPRIPIPIYGMGDEITSNPVQPALVNPFNADGGEEIPLELLGKSKPRKVSSNLTPRRKRQRRLQSDACPDSNSILSAASALSKVSARSTRSTRSAISGVEAVRAAREMGAKVPVPKQVYMRRMGCCVTTSVVIVSMAITIGAAIVVLVRPDIVPLKSSLNAMGQIGYPIIITRLNGFIRFAGVEYIDEFADPDTPEFKKVAKDACTAISRAFLQSELEENFRMCNVYRIMRGSTVVSFKIKFKVPLFGGHGIVTQGEAVVPLKTFLNPENPDLATDTFVHSYQPLPKYIRLRRPDYSLTYEGSLEELELNSRFLGNPELYCPQTTNIGSEYFEYKEDTECKEFVMCGEGGRYAYIFTCPGKTHWDPQLKTCSSHDVICKNGPTTPSTQLNTTKNSINKKSSN